MTLPLRDNVPTRSFPLVTVGLIVANVLVFLWENARLEQRVVEYGYYPCKLAASCVPPGTLAAIPWPEAVFTSMFMHGGWVHLLGNMLFLWIFGNNVEDALGKGRFLLFYVLGGLAATALQTAVTLHYAGPQGESVPNVGASGAIAAVLGAYFLLLPNAKVLTLVGFFFVELPAVVFLGIWIALQLWQGGGGLTHPEEGGGVAFFAHIGGFAFGLLAVRAFQIRKPLRPSW
jgi:membrane associated rhomboid family serine protease